MAAGTGSSRVLTFIAAIVLARSMTVEAFGAFSIAFTVAMLISQLPSILDVAFVRGAAAATSARAKHPWTHAFLRAKLQVTVPIIVTSPLLAHLIAERVLAKPELTFVVGAGVASGALMSIFASLPALLQSEDRLVAFGVAQASLGVSILIAVMIYVGGFEVSSRGAIVIHALIYAIGGSIAFAWLFRRSRGFAARETRSTSRELWGFAAWLLPAMACYAVLQRLDVFVVGRTATLLDIGFYAGAVRIAAGFSLLTGVLPVVFLPKAAAARATKVGRRAFFRTAFAVVGLVTISLAIALAVAPTMLGALLGTEYVVAANVLRWLLLAQIIAVVGSPLSDMIHAEGWGACVFGQRLCQLLAALLAMWWMVPRYSLEGAAMAMAVAAGVGTAFVTLSYGIARRRESVRNS